VNTSRYRVIQWATGAVGTHALRALIEDPELELVGVYVHDPRKVGRDAGELAGLPVRTGVTATDDADRLRATAADCVVYTAVGETRPREAVAEIAGLLRSGKNVVSTSMMNLIHPASANPKLTGPLEAACREGGTTLFTNGIDPGFSGDLMPLAALSLCERVERIRVQELADYGAHPDPSWAAPFGFGKPPDWPAPILAPGVPTLFWGGMVRLLAGALRVTLDALSETTERCVATERFEVPMTVIEAGTVSAIRFAVAGIVAGKPVISAEHVTRTRADQAPDWPRPPAGHGSVHRVVIDGSPSLTLDLTLRGGAGGRGGVLATAMRVVNTIPAVCDAPPGLITTLDLPIAPRRLLMRDRINKIDKIF
jgi:4-hydroxy-tetrahydrodipicolinate reductase